VRATPSGGRRGMVLRARVRFRCVHERGRVGPVQRGNVPWGEPKSRCRCGSVSAQWCSPHAGRVGSPKRGAVGAAEGAGAHVIWNETWPQKRDGPPNLRTCAGHSAEEGAVTFGPRGGTGTKATLSAAPPIPDGWAHTSRLACCRARAGARRSSRWLSTMLPCAAWAAPAGCTLYMVCSQRFAQRLSAACASGRRSEVQAAGHATITSYANRAPFRKRSRPVSDLSDVTDGAKRTDAMARVLRCMPGGT
jgi:hypothetical protein